MFQEHLSFDGIGDAAAKHLEQLPHVFRVDAHGLEKAFQFSDLDFLVRKEPRSPSSVGGLKAHENIQRTIASSHIGAQCLGQRGTVPRGIARNTPSVVQQAP